MERALETAQVFGSLLATILVLFVPITVGVVLVQRWVGPERLQRWLGGRSLPVAVVKGTVLGAVTPFCGCSTIPLLLGLLRANVRFAAVAAFMLASPLLNPYILAVVTLLFGWQVMAAYAAVAVGSTLVLATVWELTGLQRHLKVPGYAPQVLAARGAATGRAIAAAVPSTGGMPVPGTSPDSDTTAGAATAVVSGDAGTMGVCGAASEPCGGEPLEARDEATPAADGCAGGTETPAAWRGPRVETVAAWGEARELLRPMWVPMLLGLGIGAAIYGAVPDGAVADLLGDSTWFTLPVAAVLGLPLYLRGEAAFPIGAGLLAAGVGEGPMFAMVIAGMGASIPEVTILSGIFRRRLLAAFLASVFAMAIVGGALIPVLV